MSNLHLYVPKKTIGLSFKGVKKTVVPSQAMTLKEIIKRFIRHESLPVKKEGFYEDRMGDLEKMGNMDITEQLEIAGELKANIASGRKRMKEKEEAAKVVVPPPVVPPG